MGLVGSSAGHATRFPSLSPSGQALQLCLASSSTVAGSKGQGHVSCSYTLRFSSAALTPPGSALLFYRWGAEPSIWIAFPFSLTESQLSHLSQVARGGDETYSSHTLVIYDIWRRGWGQLSYFHTHKHGLPSLSPRGSALLSFPGEGKKAFLRKCCTFYFVPYSTSTCSHNVWMIKGPASLTMEASDSKIPNCPSNIWNSCGHFSNRRLKVDPGNVLLLLVGVRASLWVPFLQTTLQITLKR